MTDDKAKTSSNGGKDASKLTGKEIAVKQLVTITPAPRTAAELAASYAGQRVANLWPQQSKEEVEKTIAALVKRGVLKHGRKAPNDKPTIELAEKR